MSVRTGHDWLSPRGRQWLVALSDPLGRTSTPPHPLRLADLPVLSDAASAHGILPSVARNLRAIASNGRGRDVVVGPDPQLLIERTSAALDERAVALTGQSMLLLHHGRRICAALSQHSVPAAIVKGPLFADALYPHPSERSFTDIDILIPHSALPACDLILQELGFTVAPSPLHSGRDYGEYKWKLPGQPLVLVEVQTDLIHSPALRSGIRFQHSDLMAAGNGCSTDATVLLVLAAIHGAAGHQFERLQPVIDVLQAVRGAAGPIDVRRLMTAAEATGSRVAIQTALDLAADLFGEPSARSLADEFDPVPWRRVRRRLVSPQVVLRSQSRKGGRDLWRRRALREMIRVIGKPGISAAG